jgi:hypothetical protein
LVSHAPEPGTSGKQIAEQKQPAGHSPYGPFSVTHAGGSGQTPASVPSEKQYTAHGASTTFASASGFFVSPQPTNETASMAGTRSFMRASVGGARQDRQRGSRRGGA